MDDANKSLSFEPGEKTKLKHVGGINDELGGVDPDIDNNLMRLSGGP